MLTGYLVATIGLPLPRLTAGSTTIDACALKKCGCPVTGAPEGCCCTKPVVRHSCCESNSPAEPTTEITLVIGYSARQCHGQDADDLCTMIAVLPPPAVAWTCFEQPEGWLADVAFSPSTAPTTPAIPPPRTAA